MSNFEIFADALKREMPLKEIQPILPKHEDVLGPEWQIKAAIFGRVDILEQLSLHPTFNIHAKDNLDRTVLHWAAMRGRISVVAWLEKRDVNFDMQDKFGRTALHYAAYAKNMDLVARLRLKSNVTLKNKNGRTADDILRSRFLPSTKELLTDFDSGEKEQNNSFNLSRGYPVSSSSQQYPEKQNKVKGSQEESAASVKHRHEKPASLRAKL